MGKSSQMKKLNNIQKTLASISICFCLLLVSEISYGARVDTLRIDSAVMQKEMPSAVVVPESYDGNSSDYPVLYLLHGGRGEFRDWLTKLPDNQLVHKMADQYNIIIVLPEGGALSYYFDSPMMEESQYMSYISKDLRAEVDQKYRTIAEKRGRVIAGLSMGGHGAFYIATKNPKLYIAAGSMSGVMDINPRTWDVPDEFVQTRLGTFAELLGPPENSINPYRDYTAVGLVDQMKLNNVQLIFECGRDDFLIEPNRTLHKKLLENGTPHVYIERPGSHTWDYWENALPYHMLYFHKLLIENEATVEDIRS